MKTSTTLPAPEPGAPDAALSPTAIGLILATGIALQAALAGLGLPPAGRGWVGDEAMYLRVASAWAAGREAALEPLWPAGYPALLALWLRAFAAPAGLLLVQIAAHLFAALTLARLATRATGDRRLGTFAGLLLVSDPQVAAFAQTLWPESLHLALALALLERAWLGRGGRAAAVGVGALSGACVALKSLLGPLAPFAWLLFARRAAAGSRLLVFALATVTHAAVLAPLVWTNIAQHGYRGVSDSLPFNLLLGLEDRSPRSLVDDRGGEALRRHFASGIDFDERRAATWKRIGELVDDRGALAIARGQFPRQLFRLFDRESYLRAMLPDGSLASQGRGFVDPPPRLAEGVRAFGHLHYLGLLAAAPWGFATLLARGERSARAARLALAWIAALLVLFLVLHVKSRYRLFLLPAFDFAAAAAFAGAWRRSPLPHRVGWLPRLLAVLAAATLWLLAFGGDRI